MCSWRLRKVSCPGWAGQNGFSRVPGALSRTRLTQSLPTVPTVSRPSARERTERTCTNAGVDATVIALWLGHADVRSTNAYLHADLSIKERALALTTPTQSPPGRYRPTDPLLAFLEAL